VTVRITDIVIDSHDPNRAANFWCAVSSGGFGPGWVLEESPDSACDVALEAASDLAVGLALGAPLVAVVAGRLVVVGSSKRDDEEGVVEWPGHVFG
jgi:hypothetical protein